MNTLSDRGDSSETVFNPERLEPDNHDYEDLKLPLDGVPPAHPDEISVDDYVAAQDPETQAAIAREAGWAKAALGVLGAPRCMKK